MSQAYDWKRFWCPRSGKINLAGFGYLYDPDTDFGRYCNPDLVTFDAIAHIPCLALLGEPGIGKSSAIKVEKEKIAAQIQQEGSQLLWLDLRAYGNEERLIRNLFDSQKFQAWVQGNYRLYIFLDSLDECLLRINTLAALLVEELTNYSDKIEQLYLRIACRSADWRSSLEQGLKELWGEELVGVYELAPLRRFDIASAAKTEGLDENVFLQAIEQQEVTPLAIKPITLNLLLNTYRKNGSLPAQQAELYLQGCRLLCEETNQNRRDTGLAGNLIADQRIVIAARIAAVTVFCNRYAVWMNIDQGDVPQEDVVIRELVSGTEFALGDEFPVTEEAVREVLSTALFSSRGPHRMGWAHQTYAEFLAAWYLQHRQLTLEQMMSLIVHPGDSDSKLIPQLHETAAWLSSMNQEVFQEVMKTNPDILLNSSVATADDTVKANLVDSLLKLYDEDKLVYEPTFGAYTHLKHQNLATQLQAYICDATKNETARYVAIEIAQQCEVKSLQDDLASVALASDQPYWVRVNAADTICRIGDKDTKAKLKPLAFGEAGDDPEDELRGFGLRAVYPNHLTTAELFSIITQPQKSAIGGTYQNFIAKEIGQYIKLDDLSIGLKWVEQQPTRHNQHYPFDKLSDAIMLKAWQNLDKSEILEDFTKVVYLKLKNFEKVLEQIIEDNEELSAEEKLINHDKKRRQLIEVITASILEADFQEKIGILSYNLVSREKDFFWLFQELREAVSEIQQQAWAKLIWNAFQRFDIEQVNTILTVSQKIPVLKAEFTSLIDPIELDSPKAREMIKSYLEDEEFWQHHRQLQQHNQQLLNPPPKKRIIALLNQFESGAINLWCQICHDMTLMPNSKHYDNMLLLKPNITTLPGWGEAEVLTKQRIIEAAKVYIDKGYPRTEQSLGTNKFYYSTLAGYKALHLILKEEPEYISRISGDIWKKWAATILDYPKTGNEEYEGVRQELVSFAYKIAPDEVINMLIILIDHENHEHGINIDRAIEKCWDERLASAIFNKIQDKKLKPQNFGELLEELIKHKYEQAKAFAKSLISLPLPRDGEERAKALAAAKALVNYADDAGWSAVWSAIQQDPEFGREVIESVSFFLSYQGSLEQRLKEEYIVDLYIFLVQQYPWIEKSKQEDSKTEELTGIEAYAVEPEDEIQTWINYIPQRLKDRGTLEACEAIRRIMHKLPEQKDKLKRFLLEAEALTRRNTWIPPQPSLIIELAKSQNRKEIQPLVNYGIIQNIKDSTVHGSVQALQGDQNQQTIEKANAESQKNS
jgi:predicted NACHT family NTPase